MAKKEKLDEKMQADILTAHMGLAAEPAKAEKSEGCLSSEELADVAANLCTPEQRQQALDHFSSCQTCYDEWVSLCFSLMSVESGSAGKAPLVTVRNLGYLGSALAIAASVVLYINISRDMNMQEVAPLPRSQENALHRPTEPVPAPSMEGKSSAPAKMKRQAVEAQSLGYSDSFEKRETLADTAVTEENAVEELKAGVQGSDAKSADAIAKWLIVVEYACKTGNTNGLFWQSLYDDGQNLLSGADATQGDVIRSVLQLLPGSDQALDVTEQCGKIVSLLAEPGEKQ